MNYDQLTKLKELNLYSGLLKGGIIPLSVNASFEIYNYFQIRLIVNKSFSDVKTLSYLETSERFNCSEMTIRRAIKFMES
tara:strand:+ start:339 stop:578 length:240 start_codon:yes stop_codon:yes gene_type:complete